MRRESKVAVLLALGGVAAAGVTPAQSAVPPCKGNDQLIAVNGDPFRAGFDTNANGSICTGERHTQGAPKKKGGGITTVYYDDRG